MVSSLFTRWFAPVWDFGGGDWRFGKLEAGGAAELAGSVIFTGITGSMPVNTTGVFLSAGTRSGTLTPPENWTVLQIGGSLAAVWNGGGGV